MANPKQPASPAENVHRNLNFAYLKSLLPHIVVNHLIQHIMNLSRRLQALLLLSLISPATAIPREVILKLSYQAKGISFSDWVSLLTLCLTPLVVHVIAGTPEVVCLPNARKHLKWHHRFCQYNPTTILWRYFAIADLRLRAKSWSAADMAASNVSFWTARGWDGSEDMIQKSRFNLRKAPNHTRAAVFSKSFVKTAVIIIQGVQAIYVLVKGFTSQAQAAYVMNIALGEIFFPLAVLGLARLFAAPWLTEDFFYDEHEDRDEIPLSPQSTKTSQSRLNLIETRAPSTIGLFEPIDHLPEVTFHPPSSWRGRIFRFIFITLIISFWAICLVYMIPWGRTGIFYEAPTLLIVNMFYLIFLTATILIFIYYFVSGHSATTVIPCIVSTWYQIYTGILVVMTLLLILIAGIETRKTLCGTYTTWPTDAGGYDAWACGGYYIYPNSTEGAFGLAMKTTNSSNQTLLPQGEYRITEWTGICMGSEGASQYVFSTNASLYNDSIASV